MKKMKKARILAIVIALSMALGILPMEGTALQVRAQETKSSSETSTVEALQLPEEEEESSKPEETKKEEKSSEPEELKREEESSEPEETKKEEESSKPEEAKEEAESEEISQEENKEQSENLPLEITEGDSKYYTNDFSQSDEFVIIGFLQDSEELVYSGNRITQNITIYHREKQLIEGEDFILKYHNNINASSYNSLDAPSVTIMMKGMYTGTRTLYFSIYPRDIGKDPEVSKEEEQVVVYPGNCTVPQPMFYFQNKPLVKDKDFQCNYLEGTLPEDYFTGDLYDHIGKSYEYEVKGIGNFTGTVTMSLTVIESVDSDFANMDVKLKTYEYEYTGKPFKADEIRIEYVKISGMTVDPIYYQCSISADKPGTAYVYIEPTEEGIKKGYHGRKEILITLSEKRNIDNAELVSWKDEIAFSPRLVTENKGIYQPEMKLKWQSGEEVEYLEENIDYTIKHDRADKIGNVTVTFVGKGKYEGTKTKSYKIVINMEELKLTHIDGKPYEKNGVKPQVSYQKNGVIPEVTLTYEEDYRLIKGKDYSVKTRNNQAIGTMYLEISGKGNYANYHSFIEIEIVQSDIANATMIVKDQKYSQEADGWKSPIEVRDANGRLLAMGKDYNKEVTYSYDPQNTSESGTPEVGTKVTVTVYGINNYKGTLSGTYHICQWKINDFQIVVDPQVYTGSEVKPSIDDIHVYKDGEEIEITPAWIVGYQNNIRVGLGRVILRGMDEYGEYGGTRTCHFAICKKTIENVRIGNLIMQETDLVMSRGEEKEITVQIYPEDADCQEIQWISSNDNIATVNKTGDLTARVTAKEFGKVRIEAINPESGERAVCRVEVKALPVEFFELNTPFVEGYTGKTFDLSIMEDTIEPKNADPMPVIWNSSDMEIVEVDENGSLTFNKSGWAEITVHYEGSEYIGKCTVWVEEQKEGENKEPHTNFVTPAEYKAPGDLSDQNSFKLAYDAIKYTGGILYVPAGNYQIDASVGVKVASNMKLIMDSEAVLEAYPTSDDKYHVVVLYDRDNSVVAGGKIVGDRYRFAGVRNSEDHMGIQLIKSKNVRISNVEITDCWTDGIYIGSDNQNKTDPPSQNVTVTNCILDNNRRNNISVTNGDNIIIDGCVIKNANGTNPQYGIDIESNYDEIVCEGITISNCLITGNVNASVGISTPRSDLNAPNASLAQSGDRITIKSSILEGTLLNVAGTNMVLNDCTVNGNITSKIGIGMNNTIVNSGSEKEDTLIASFDPDIHRITFSPYNHNNNMTGLYRTGYLGNGDVYLMTRTAQVNKNTGPGYSMKLADIMNNGDSKLKAGVTYRLEYTAMGTGQWYVETDQAGGYYYRPENHMSTGFINVTAKSWGSGNMMFYAIDDTVNMFMALDSVKIYQVN